MIQCWTVTSNKKTRREKAHRSRNTQARNIHYLPRNNVSAILNKSLTDLLIRCQLRKWWSMGKERRRHRKNNMNGFLKSFQPLNLLKTLKEFCRGRSPGPSLLLSLVCLSLQISWCSTRNKCIHTCGDWQRPWKQHHVYMSYMLLCNCFVESWDFSTTEHLLIILPDP